MEGICASTIMPEKNHQYAASGVKPCKQMENNSVKLVSRQCEGRMENDWEESLEFYSKGGGACSIPSKWQLKQINSKKHMLK